MRSPRRPMYLLFLFLLFVGIPLLTLCPVGTLARGQNTPRTPQKWGLLIGIDEYKDKTRITRLHGAAADARALKTALIEAAGVPAKNIRLLVSDAQPGEENAALPNKDVILDEVRKLSGDSIQPGDTVFVFYSGHGVEIGGKPYLVPYDANALDDEDLADSSISTTRLRDRLSRVPAGLLFVALDMCRSVPVRSGRAGVVPANILTRSQVRGMDFSGTVPTASRPTEGPRSVVTLFSCAEKQRSYEDAARGRGYFSWFLEQGLRGEAKDKDGAVMVASLTDYVTRKVKEAVLRAEKQTQTPQVEVKGEMGATSIALTPSAASGTVAGSLTNEPVTDSRARLHLTLSPSNAAVTVNGVQHSLAAGNVLAIDLGMESEKTIELGVAAPGYRPRVLSISLKRATVVPLNLALSAISAKPETPEKPEKLVIVPTPPSENTGASSDNNANPATGLPKTSLPLPPGVEMKINPVDGAEMIRIPAGAFVMGNDRGNPDQLPQRRVALKAYWIYRYPVTVVQFRKFSQETGYPMVKEPPQGYHDSHAVGMVTNGDAEAYCRWAGGRLPTEAEWEKAGRGTDGRLFPWGNQWDPTRLGGEKPLGYPVGSYPAGASPYGVMDMVGCIWQRVEDDHNPKGYGGLSANNPVNPQVAGRNRSIRGLCPPFTVKTLNDQKGFWVTHRGIGSNVEWEGSGFRVVVDSEAEASPAAPDSSAKPVTNASLALLPPPTAIQKIRPPLTLAAYKAQMVTIPAGEFLMGSDENIRPDYGPAHTVSLSAYRIGRTEVTVGMWEEFCKATKRKMPPSPPFNLVWAQKDHPIVNVSWTDAQAYCKWAGLKLPTEAQWEKAARGTDGRRWPWGNEWNGEHLSASKNTIGSAGGTRAVGSFPAGVSPYGCVDMAGNVSEWCEDFFDPDFYRTSASSTPDPVKKSNSYGKGHVTRGGSWDNKGTTAFLTATRWRESPSLRHNAGFRCAAPAR